MYNVVDEKVSLCSAETQASPVKLWIDKQTLILILHMF